MTMITRSSQRLCSAKLMNSIVPSYVGRKVKEVTENSPMRKLTYLGVMLLLLGIVCGVVGAVNLQNVTSVNVGQSESEVWSYALNLTSGNTYWLYIESGNAWGLAFTTAGGYTTAQPVNVTIASPSGGVTSLQAFFYSIPPTSPYYKTGTPPAIVDVIFENVDYLSLDADSSSGKIQFSVKESGLYNATVINGGWIDTPPAFFRFYEEVASNRNSYALLASGGGVVGIIGGVTLVVSVFRKGGVRHKKNHG
jgi:hypothetical protein